MGNENASRRPSFVEHSSEDEAVNGNCVGNREEEDEEEDEDEDAKGLGGAQKKRSDLMQTGDVSLSWSKTTPAPAVYAMEFVAEAKPAEVDTVVPMTRLTVNCGDPPGLCLRTCSGVSNRVGEGFTKGGIGCCCCC